MDKQREEKPLDQQERRRHDRSRLIVDVFFNGRDATGVASTKDISLGGLYMKTHAEVPDGETLMIRIPLGNEQIVCSAEVVYRNPGLGLGVRFIDLSDEARAVLEREIWHV
ncbi:MAG TPA: PilZ domain-containing protein [Pyrinomonadaceae bacterium]